jgi:hypothetical protein
MIEAIVYTLDGYDDAPSASLRSEGNLVSLEVRA